LRAYGIEYHPLTAKGSGLIGLLRELAAQQLQITRLLRHRPVDLMLQIGGIFNAPVGRLRCIPTIAISDTENDRWGNLLSFSLSKHVLLPSCFDHRTGGTWRNQIAYPGYHELAYLAPRYFPGPIEPQMKFLVRFVGWGAGHDIGEKCLSDAQKVALVELLQHFGTVHVSSEMALPRAVEAHRIRLHPAEIHAFMKTCKLVVGESATMASEAACLGIPAIFISNTGRGYTTEQDQKYDLIRHFRLDQWNEIMRCAEDWARRDVHADWQCKRRRMLRDKIDVTGWLVDLIENYPGSLAAARRGDFERYRITCAG
jgi:predicted glycosyltransferase